MHREDQNFAGRTLGPDLGGEVESAASWHRNIQNDQIGRQSSDCLHRLDGIRGFAANLPGRAEFREKSPNTLPYDLMVIDNQNPRMHKQSLYPAPAVAEPAGTMARTIVPVSFEEISNLPPI